MVLGQKVSNSKKSESIHGRVRLTRSILFKAYYSCNKGGANHIYSAYLSFQIIPLIWLLFMRFIKRITPPMVAGAGNISLFNRDSIWIYSFKFEIAQSWKGQFE